MDSSFSSCLVTEGPRAGWQQEEAAAVTVLTAAVFWQLWSSLRSPAANPCSSVTDGRRGCANEHCNSTTVAVPGR